MGNGGASMKRRDQIQGLRSAAMVAPSLTISHFQARSA